MKLQEGVSLVAIFFSLAYTQLVKGQHQPRDDCQVKCGNITIEYPFGISSGCYYPGDDSFNLTCDEKEKLFIGINVKVVNFNDSAQLSVLFYRFSECIDEQSNETNGTALEYQLGSSFSFSSKNKFTLVGCNALALLSTFGKQNYSTGCLSLCDSQPEANEIRNGVGFCQTDVFDGYKVQFGSARLANQINNSVVNTSGSAECHGFPCGTGLVYWKPDMRQAGSTSICGGNSTCFDSTTRPGYVCKCKGGYHGNPYHPDGCQDIDECIIDTHNCSDPKTCKNRDGGFDCKCPSGYNLITTINSTMKCTRPEYFRRTQFFLVTTIGFLVLLLAVISIQHATKHRKDAKLRRQFFEQNGGGMLIQQISRVGSSNIDFKIFTEEGMMEATNGYDESRILGQGGQGTVYKGILPDNSTVAIKKARVGDRSQVDQFVHEMIVLSQINHRNVVKLLGCCLETEFPLLVYEFITSGTLFDHLHGSMFDSSLTWEHRLRIAIEVAGTLAYLHSAASVPIIHRDVKTANILLDENLTAKVADFGASKLIPMDKEQLTTMVQGTLGYLDPEYYTTGLLNEKSDVYSFGVVLMELLSGEKALCFERPETSKHLVSYFASATKENRLHEIIDGQVMNEDNEREIQKAATIAVECTRIMGEERPRMKEVAAELEALRVKTTKHKWSDQNPEENEHLLGGHIVSAQGDISSRGYDSIKNVARFDIEAGR